MKKLAPLIFVAVGVILFANQAKGIISGKEAAQDQFKYQVSLQINGKHICGGVVIGDKFLASAGQCGYDNIAKTFVKDRITVVASTVDLTDPTSLITANVDKIYIPKSYTEDKSIPLLKGDFAVYKLDRALGLSRNSKLSKLRIADDYNLYINKTLTITGFGLKNYKVTKNVGRKSPESENPTNNNPENENTANSTDSNSGDNSLKDGSSVSSGSSSSSRPSSPSRPGRPSSPNSPTNKGPLRKRPVSNSPPRRNPLAKELRRAQSLDGKLRYAKAKVSRSYSCNSIHPDHIESSNMCVKVQRSDKARATGTCMGDAGSPLAHDGNVLLGVLIAGPRDCIDEEQKEIYSSALYYRKFILAAVADKKSPRIVSATWRRSRTSAKGYEYVQD